MKIVEKSKNIIAKNKLHISNLYNFNQIFLAFRNSRIYTLYNKLEMYLF